MNWRVIDAGDIAWRSWQGEVVVYSASRASTHHVGAAAGSVLTALLEQDGPLSVDEIFALAFAESSPAPAAPTASERDSIVLILDEFERTRLIERVAA
jgi:hypothetical protein